MLACENISCIRGGHTLFSGLGFCLEPGSMLLIKGANGSGKTSLLNILAGNAASEEGFITWDKKSILNNDEFNRDLMHIGHKSEINEMLTAQENVRKWAEQYGTETLVKAALAFYGLLEFKDTPAGYLSAGWQRRLMLAKLVVAPSKLWLLDEPTNFLDDEALLLTTSLIETRVRQGGIVIVATHIMNSHIGAHTLQLEDFKPDPKM